MYRLSRNGLKFLIREEGFLNRIYVDEGGYRTIGIGHKLTTEENNSGYININGEDVFYEFGLTLQQVTDLCRQDLRRFELNLGNKVNVVLTTQQIDCLLSFMFNVGVTQFNRSTLLRILNNSPEDHNRIQKELKRWVFVKGKVSKILKGRRNREAALFTKGVYTWF